MPAFSAQGNTISCDDLAHPAAAARFLRALHRVVVTMGYDAVRLDFAEAASVYPNVLTPIACAIQYYRDNHSVDFETSGLSPFLANTSFLSPQTPTAHRDALNRVWRFTSSAEVQTVVTNILHALEARTRFNPGVLNGIEWCLNEVMDNVIQHASGHPTPTTGYVMAEVHRARVALCVCDAGRGLQRSLQTLNPPPRTDDSAIRRAVEEGVTRDTSIGQGNGLWGLRRIVHENGGQLTIASGTSALTWENGSEPSAESRRPFLAPDHKGTLVDFQIRARRSIDFTAIFPRGATRFHQLSLESREDTTGAIVFRLSEETSGIGTRQSGAAIRNRVLNACVDSDSLIAIDFRDVNIVSSSFADELIGKLVATLGFTAFSQRIRLRNMNAVTAGITDRSVRQRITSGLAAPTPRLS